MAKFNEILVGRYNRYLQKLLQVKGGPPTAQLSTEVGVQIGLFHGVETRYLEGWDTFWLGLTIGPFAAIHSAVQMRNPIVNNTMVVIERLQYAVGTAGDLVSFSVQGAGTTVDLANAQFGVRMDARTQRGNSAPVSSNSGVDAGDLPSVVWVQTVAVANDAKDLVLGDSDTQIMLAPGDALRIRDNTVNSALRLSMRWRERFLEDSERA